MDDDLKKILLEIVDQVERHRVAALAQNQVLMSHNKHMRDLVARVAFLEQMLLKEDSK